MFHALRPMQTLNVHDEVIRGWKGRGHVAVYIHLSQPQQFRYRRLHEENNINALTGKPGSLSLCDWSVNAFYRES